MTTMHLLVRLGLELGLSVNDYNSGVTSDVNGIVRLTLEYLSKVREAVAEGAITEESVSDYFSLVGHAWSSLDSAVYSAKGRT